MQILDPSDFQLELIGYTDTGLKGLGLKEEFRKMLTWFLSTDSMKISVVRVVLTL